MPESLIVAPGPTGRQVKMPDGTIADVPPLWALLPPGDAGVTRRVKAAGPTWTVKAKKGRRVISMGVWADAAQIQAAKNSMRATRATTQHAKGLERARKTRQLKQEQYVEDFEAAIRSFLAFDRPHKSLADRLARAVAAHATPVGSGTVARTQRIPIQRRAEAAVIAWMRHQTTAYDSMKIARVKGERREVRRHLAQRSREVLDRYRPGGAVDPACPLAEALSRPNGTEGA